MEEFLADLPVRELPGVGRRTNAILDEMNVHTCSDLTRVSLEKLQAELGTKTGIQLYKFARGEDDREIQTEVERKSISAEMNYGIRFETDTDTNEFIHAIADELCNRMKSANLAATSFSLRIKRKKQDAGVPKKYMGHGWCDNVSKSFKLARATNDSQIIGDECLKALKPLAIPCQDFRGIGISAKNFDDIDHSVESNGLRNWLTKANQLKDKSEKKQVIAIECM